MYLDYIPVCVCVCVCVCARARVCVRERGSNRAGLFRSYRGKKEIVLQFTEEKVTLMNRHTCLNLCWRCKNSLT